MADFEWNFQILIFRTNNQGTADPDDDEYDIAISGGPTSGAPTDVVTDGDMSSTQFEIGETLSITGESGVFRGTIQLNGQDFVLVDFGGGSLNAYGNVPDPATFNPIESGTANDGVPDFTGADIGDDDAFTVCFAAGTPIATPDGERAVETLKAGDRVLTADGRSVPVKWIGYQTVRKLFTPAERFRPVRIRAGALAQNVPHADLVVTADHGMVVDGIVANAGALVNGLSIVRVPVEELPAEVVYYHVETENHEVILAAGAPAETYVDNVTRRGFDNFAEYEALFGPERRDMAELPYPRAQSRRQLPVRIREALEMRALALASADAKAA